jgi:hypothetical protein
MESTTPKILSYTELLKYKDLNKEMHPALRNFASNLTCKSKPPRHRNKNNWRRIDQRFKNNWLLDSKLNQTEDQKLYDQVRGILNKLSESNFNELADELIQLEIKNRDNLMTIVDIIFKKAIIESKYNEIYAKLCYELAPYHIRNNKSKVYFRELLLNKCQKMFEEGVSLSKDIEQRETSTFKFKEHVMGCMRFVGELYNNGLLTDKIVYNCFLILMSKVNLNKAYSIDSICTLMETVGDGFSSNAKKEFNLLFKKFDELKDNPKIEKKEKFALMDLLDLKQDKKW